VRNLGVHLVQGFFLHRPSGAAVRQAEREAVKT